MKALAQEWMDQCRDALDALFARFIAGGRVSPLAYAPHSISAGRYCCGRPKKNRRLRFRRYLGGNFGVLAVDAPGEFRIYDSLAGVVECSLRNRSTGSANFRISTKFRMEPVIIFHFRDQLEALRRRRMPVRTCGAWGVPVKPASGGRMVPATICPSARRSAMPAEGPLVA